MMAYHTTLQQLAADASARSHDSIAQSIGGVIALLDAGDPVDVATAHDLWIDNLKHDVILLRLLGPGVEYHAESAFSAVVHLRVILEIQAWMEEKSRSVGV